jgi:TolB-like protein/Tfp pilus assembly protein PilF
VSLLAELKRRNVFRVAAAYLALGWIVTQVTATVAPMMHLPEWIAPVVVWIGAIGFPFVLLFSWVYELTPEGLRRESEIERTSSITHATAKRLDTIVIALLVVAIGLFVLDRFTAVGAGHARDDRAHGALPQEEDSRGHGPLLQQQQAAPGPAATDNSIAVLPFADMSQDKDQEYFSDGLSEELLNLLAQVPELRVIARTSSFAFKGQNASIATIAQSLNVAHVLEGSVRKSGNTLRITAQLVRAADSSHLWSATYDREMTDIFRVQDEIAGAVVDALKLKLLPGQEHATAKPPSANTEAYTQFLLGRQYLNRENAESWGAAVKAFGKAIELDPDYAAAWAGLSVAENFDSDYVATAEASMAGKARALEAAERAVALDPRLADAYIARAYLRATQQWNWQGAEADYRRAVELDPADVTVLRRYSALLNALGRLEESIAMARRAVELDPLSAPAWIRLGAALIATDRVSARQALERALAINPGSDFARSWLLVLELTDGRPEAALEVSRPASRVWQLLGEALAQHTLGHAQAAQQALDALEAEFGGTAAYQIGMVHAWRGDNDAAFEWLERAREQHDGGLTLLGVDPIVGPSLRADPRYAEMLKKLGLVP